jgi:hypothetical protein
MENGKNLIHSFNDSDGIIGNFKGLTKREYFAGLAMQGMLSSRDWTQEPFNEGTASLTSKFAIEIADELLKQLEK